MKRRWVTAACAHSVLLAACSSAGFQKMPVQPEEAYASPCQISRIEISARLDIPAGYRLSGTAFGGISGIDYSPVTDEWLLVSDARQADGGTHVYRVRGANLGSGLFSSGELEAAEALARLPEGSVRPLVDAEAIRFAGDGRSFYLATEGEESSGIEPGILRWDFSEQFAKSIPLAGPPSNGTGAPASRTVRANLSFEGLSNSPDSDGLWYGLEGPYQEEGDLPTLEHGALVPIVHIDYDGRFIRDFRYSVEPIAAQLPGRLADNGLSEILALKGDRFLVLERSGTQQDDSTFRFTGRLFCAWKEDRTAVLRKTLITEINSLGSFERMNFEGMTFGPTLPDGRTSLVLVNDNNFVPETPTTILMLAID